jgi:hypothetical protein
MESLLQTERGFKFNDKDENHVGLLHCAVLEPCDQVARNSRLTTLMDTESSA